MEPKLDIFCPEINMSHNDNLKTKLQAFRNKFNEIFYPEDTWTIPFEEIDIANNESHFSCGRNEFRGSQGQVFFPTYKGKKVAVKRVQDKTLAQIDHLRDLNHRNIIKFLGISSDAQYHYIIMEYCSLGTLHRRRSGPIFDYIDQIADGVKYLHSKKIIHCDLKPSNILVTYNDVIKIADFGSHIVLRGSACQNYNPNPGTIQYTAPEVIKGEPLTFAIDVWSFGVLVWELLTGQEPFNNIEESAIAYKLAYKNLRLPIPEDFPDVYTRILNSCWHSEPSGRIDFKQICISLQHSKNEIELISRQQWRQQQEKWKRFARRDQIQHDIDRADLDDCIQKLEDEKREIKRQAKKQRDMHYQLELAVLELQEVQKNLQNDRDELTKREQDLNRRQEELDKKELDLTRNRDDVIHLDKESCSSCPQCGHVFRAKTRSNSNELITTNDNL